MGDEAGNLEGKSLSNLRVVDLKMELEKRGLSKSGSKKDLVKRLKQKLELEKLYEESSAIGESEPKLQLDEATEQNEFVQQYLAEQREIYARQKEVRRLIELKEQEESGGTDDSDSGMKDQDSDVSEGLSLSKSTCDSSAIVEGEDEDHHEQEQKSISRKSESEEVSATPVESASCNQENPCDSTNSPNQPTDGKSEQSDIPTEMESKSRDAVAFSLLDISLPESPKVLSGRSGSKSPRSAVDKLPQKTNSHQPDSVAAEPDNLKTNGSVKKMPRSGKRRWSDAKKTPAQEVSDSTKYAELEAKLATEDVVLKGKLDSKNLNVDDSIMKADTKVDSSNKVEAETISGDTKALPSKPGEDSDVATRSNWKNTDQETSSVSLFPEQVSEVSESNESKGKPSIEAVDEEKNEVGISKKEKKMDSDSEIMGKSKTSNQSVKKVEKHEKFASRSRKTKKQERSSSSSSSSASSRSSSPEMRTSSRRRKGSKSPKARYERDSDVKQRHRDVRHGRDSKHRRGLEKTWSTSPDAKRSRSPNVKQRKEADSKQRKSVRANRSSSSDEKLSKSPDFKQRREADLEKVDEGRGRSPIVMRKKSSHAYSRTPVVRKRSRSPAVTRKKSPRKSSRSPDARRSKSPVVARKKSPHKSSRSPDARRSKSPVVTRKKSPHKSSRSPDARRSKSPVVTRKKSPHKSNSSPDARQSKSPDGNQRREAELKQRRSPVASRSRSPNAKQGSPEVSQSTDLMTDKTTEEKKTHSAKHKSISPNKHTQRSSPLKRRSHSPSPRQGSRPKESVRPRKGQSVSPRKRQSVSPAKIHSASPQQRQNPSSVKGRSSSPEETQSASLGKSDKKRNVEGEKSLNRDDSSDSSSDSDRRESQRPTPLKPAVLPKKRLSRIAENKVLSEKKIELEPRQPRRPKLNRTSFSMSEDVVMKDVEEKNKEIACLKLNESVVSLQEKVSKIEDMAMEDEKRLSLAAAAAAPEMPPEKISYRKLNTPFKKHEDKDKNLGRKRRWRSSSNMLQNTAMVISSDSLKNLIPEFKLTPVPSKEMDTKSKESENLTGNETAASKVDEANKDEIGEEKVTTPKVAKIDGAHALKAVKASGATSSKITLKEKKKLAEDSVISRPSCSAFSSALRLFKPNKSSIKSSLQGKKKDDETIKKEDLVKKDIDLAKVPALPVDRSEPVPSKPPSCIIFIQNLVRPFTLMQLKNLLNQTGTIVEEGFWIDKIKSKCFVKYETEEEAVKTREALHETRWPPSNPKILSADFSNQDEFDRCSRGYDVPMPPVPIAAAVTTQPDIRKREENLDLTDLRKKRLERHSKDREHSRQNVTYVREWDKDKLTQDSPERDRSRLIKERNRSSERRRETKRADSKKKTLEDTPAKLLDDLFQKTKNTPCIYWLPLTEEQVKAQEEERRQRRLDREKRNQLAREQEAERRAKRKPREKDTRSRSRSRQGRRR